MHVYIYLSHRRVKINNINMNIPLGFGMQFLYPLLKYPQFVAQITRLKINYALHFTS